MKITWHLDGGRKISKRGPGIQQVFATLSPKERSDITGNCTHVTTEPT